MPGSQPESRPRRLRLKPEYQPIAKRISQERYQTTQNWVEAVKLSRTTVWRFLKGEPLSFDPFEELCRCLDLDWLEVGEILTDLQSPSLPSSGNNSVSIDAIRHKVYPRIQHACGTIQLFGRPILMSRYVELSVLRLDELPARRYESLELLGNDFALDHYDRDLGTIRNLPRVSGTQAALDHSCLLVYGWPGAGKTSYLKWLATQCNEGALHSDLVPVFLRARNFYLHQKRKSLLDCIADFLEHADVGNSQQIAINLLRSGKLLLFVDGLDELPEELSRVVCDDLATVVDSYFQCRFVFSCRLPLILPFPRFQKVLIAGFDNEQRQNFAREWFSSETEETTLLNAFLQRLRKHKALSELTRTPLLMELLCRVFRDHREFPPTRADLYMRGIEDLLYRNSSLPQQELLQQLDRDTVWKFLRHIAADFFIREEPLILLDRREVVRQAQTIFSPIFKKELDESSATRILERIELNYGLLITHSWNFYAFSHLTFQEYFTAEYLVRNKQHDVVLKHVTDPKWRFVIELVAELLPEDEQESFFNQFKDALDGLVTSNAKLCNFLRWVDWMANQVHDTVDTPTPHKQTLLRAWYFTFTLKDSFVSSQPGQLSPFFVLPDFDMATSMLTGEVLRVHMQLYQAFHATWTDRYTVFERTVSAIRESIRQAADEFNEELLSVLNQLDGWITVMQSQRAQSNHPVFWWESYRSYWRERICYLMEELHGLRSDWQFTEDEERILRMYYGASRLLSICTIRAIQRLPVSQRHHLADSLLSIPRQQPERDDFVGF